MPAAGRSFPPAAGTRPIVHAIDGVSVFSRLHQRLLSRDQSARSAGFICGSGAHVDIKIDSDKAPEQVRFINPRSLVPVLDLVVIDDGLPLAKRLKKLRLSGKSG